MIDLPVLVVENDQHAHRSALVDALRSDGFAVSSATTLTSCLDQLAATNPAIVLIDLDFADATGLAVCQHVRLHSQVPVITIADETSPIDAITTLAIGADDHVVRPYRPSELSARIRAVLRRSTHHPPAEPFAEGAITVDHVALDPGAHSVHVNGRPVQLPLKEFELLHELMANAGKVLPREVLLRRIWHRDTAHGTKTLDVHIKRLRDKIDIADRHSSMITTVRGLGYRLEQRDRVRSTATQPSSLGSGQLRVDRHRAAQLR